MNSYIQKIINEQFNISNMDFGKKSNNRMNIFNKNIIDFVKMYERLAAGWEIKDDEVKQLNDLYGAVKCRDKRDLQTILAMYAYNYPTDSLNWLDVSEITDMSELFFIDKYNINEYKGDISHWDVSNVNDMKCMFKRSRFNNDISSWDVSKVSNMEQMFYKSEFNNDISGWNVSGVTNMSGMFLSSVFNQDISKWDVSHVTDMSMMFGSSVFTGDISKWDVSHVTDMHQMFESSKFNGDISGWDVSNVADMYEMFAFSPFNHDISKWDVHNIEDYQYMFHDCPIKEEFKPSFKKSVNNNYYNKIYK